MLNRLTCTIIALAGSAQLLAAQAGNGTTDTLERLAARAAVDHALGGKLDGVRIVLDPNIAPADEAPGSGDVRTPRAPGRNMSLAAALGARSLPRGSVVDCPARGSCSLSETDLFITLAAPAIAGDRATVTVTTLRRTKPGTRNRTQYRTVNVLLRRTEAGWEVTGFRDLGIS